MYKVLLIDDEPLIREGLRQVINWEEYGFTICADTADGRAGLNMIRFHQPDLVIVDIRMPGLSGIELVEQAKQEGYSCKFIILSGYSSFSYAKELIKLGVHSYLLKPIDEEELIEGLIEIKEEIITENKIDSQLLQYNQLAEEQAWKAVVEGRIEEWQSVKCVDVNAKHFHLAAIVTHTELNCTKIKDVLVAKVEHAKLIMKDDTIYLLFFEQEKQFIKDQVLELLKALKLDHQQEGKGYISESFKTLTDVSKGLNQIEHLKQLSYCYRDENIFSYPMKQPSDVKPLCLEKVATNIVRTLEFKDDNALQKQVNQVIDYYQTVQFKKSRIQTELNELALLVMNVISETYPEVETLSKTMLSEMIHQSTSIQDFMSRVVSQLWSITEGISGFSLNSDNTMTKIISYIDYYYYEDLNLKVLGELFNYNSSYLGKKFKRHLGVYFHQYLDNVRMEKAKKLLEQDAYKVYEVSERVGYNNMDYFYKKFKRHVGMSPKEYQKKTKKQSIS